MSDHPSQPQASSMAGESSCPAEAVMAEASDSHGTGHASATSRLFVDEPRDDHLLYHRHYSDIGVEVGDYLSGEDDAVDFTTLSPGRSYTPDSYPHYDELHDGYHGELSYSYDNVGAVRFEFPPDYDRVIMQAAEMQNQQRRRPNERHHEPVEAAMRPLEGRLGELHLAPVQAGGGSALQRMAGLASYGNGGFGAVPASAASVAALERHEYAGVGGDESRGAAESAGCVICIQDYEAGDELSVMPCLHRHSFHRKCLAEWLARSRLCPLCRHALPIQE